MGGVGSGRKIGLTPGTAAAQSILTVIEDEWGSLEEFAAAAGMSAPALHRLLVNQDPNPTLRIIRRLAKASGLSLDIWR